MVRKSGFCEDLFPSQFTRVCCQWRRFPEVSTKFYGGGIPPQGDAPFVLVVISNPLQRVVYDSHVAGMRFPSFKVVFVALGITIICFLGNARSCGGEHVDDVASIQVRHDIAVDILLP